MTKLKEIHSATHPARLQRVSKTDAGHPLDEDEQVLLGAMMEDDGEA
jgi:hypothetical protein